MQITLLTLLQLDSNVYGRRKMSVCYKKFETRYDMQKIKGLNYENELIGYFKCILTRLCFDKISLVISFKSYIKECYGSNIFIGKR